MNIVTTVPDIEVKDTVEHTVLTTQIFGTPRDPEIFPYAVILDFQTDEDQQVFLRLSPGSAERMMTVIDNTLAQARRLVLEQDPDAAHERRLEAA